MPLTLEKEREAGEDDSKEGKIRRRLPRFLPLPNEEGEGSVLLLHTTRRRRRRPRPRPGDPTGALGENAFFMDDGGREEAKPLLREGAEKHKESHATLPRLFNLFHAYKFASSTKSSNQRSLIQFCGKR
jgi:hypothetical protein